MKIDFETIITKANDRKETLLALSAEMTHISDTINHLEAAAQWYDKVYKLWQSLDQEGREMLPQDVKVQLASMGSGVSLRSKLSTTSDIHNTNKISYGLYELKKLLEEK